MWDGSQNALAGVINSLAASHGQKIRMVDGMPCIDAPDNSAEMKRIRRGGGIYLLRCRVNGRKDVGMTSRFNKRKSRHFCNPTNGLLKADILKYGRDSFDYYIIEPIDLKNIPREEWGAILWERETYWVKMLWKTPGGKESSYNMVLPCIHRYSADGELFPPMDVVMAVVRRAGIRLRDDYLEMAKERGFPSNPERTYSDTWIDWDHFLGKELPPFETVMAAAQAAGLPERSAYRKWAKKHGWPTEPRRAYKDKWVNWRHFLGTEAPSFEALMAAVQAAGIVGQRAYRKWAKKQGFPSNPNIKYKGVWVSWDHLSGREKPAAAA